MNNRMLLLWLAVGAGVVLLYAAIKDKSPTGIVTGYFDNPAPNPTPDAPSTPPTGTGGGGGVRAEFRTDANGFIHDVPPTYAGNPSLFIPPTTVS